MQRPRRQQPQPLVFLRRLLLLLLVLLLSSSSWVFASLEFQLSDDTMNAFHEKNDDSNSDDDDESESLRRILWNTHQIQQQIKSLTSYARLHRPSPSNYLERSKNDNHKLRNVTLHISLPCEYFPLDKNQTLSSSSSSSHLIPSTRNTTTVLVQESTSSIMAAKALAKTVLQKTNNNNEWNLLLDDKAWSILDSLLLPPFSSRNADDDDEDENNEDEDNDHSDLFFQTQGLLPKYWYYNPPPQSHNNNIINKHNRNNTPYINGTRIPHWSLFVPNITNNHTGNHTHHNSTRTNDWIRSSFRLSALPLHASLLWDMMVAVIPPNTDHSSDPNDNDNDNLKSSYPYSYNYEHNREWWNRIERYYTHIFQHHMYLHHVVMRGCQPSSSSSKQQQQDYYNTHQNQNQKPTPSHHNSNRPTVPCYNILHPWESLMDPTSPTWDIVLQPVMQHIRHTNWHLPFAIPPLVEQAFDFPGNPLVYKAMMYLLVEGWVRKEFVVGNSTTTLAGMCQSSPSPATCAEDALLFWNTTTTTTTNTSDTDSNNNTTTTSTIPFAMLDVGYAAVLAQADADLQQLARVLQMVLPENFYAADSTRRTFEQDIATIQRWQQDNDRILQHELWNETHRTYLSKYYQAASKKMVFVNAAVSNNLIPFWNTDALDHPNPNNNNDNSQDGRNGDTTMTLSSSSSSSKSLVEVHSTNNNNNYNHHPSNDDAVTSISSTLSSWSETTRNHWKDLTLLLLRRDNRYAFDCGSFPIWSLGCQEEYHDSPTQKPPMIQPIVNYLVASGLLQNADYLDTFGQYISSQSLRLFYHDNNQKPDRHHPYHVENTTTTVFADAYSAFYPNHNLASQHDICGNTSTLTAAIVYNFRVPDPTHANRLPLPPIRRSWVITLITVELFVAFSIGVSCLVLSFSQYRKLLRDSIIVEEVVGDSAANDDTFRDEEIVALNHRDYQNFAGSNANDNNENMSTNNNDITSNNVTANYDATTVINATSSPPAPDDSLDETQPEKSRSFFARLGFN